MAVQFLADQIDQLDLALDQLAMKDRNFDRFALMLIDNVVELTLHEHAWAKNRENSLWSHVKKTKYDKAEVAAALGPRFDAKVRLAKSTKLVSAEEAETVLYLHGFRNTAYHRGLRHERILRALALLYVRTACGILAAYKPWGLMFSSRDQISHRAVKYLGFRPRSEKPFAAAWERLRELASSMGDTLVVDLSADMAATIDSIDKALAFLENDMPPGPDGEKRSRTDIIVDFQSWAFAFSDEGIKYAVDNGLGRLSRAQVVQWLSDNYRWPTRSDPVAGWRGRLESLRAEKNVHVALKKYCDFMSQTERFREQTHEAAAQLDAYIQERIDEARGK